MVRLSQIAHATESHSTGASLVDARAIVTFVVFRATDVARHGDSHCWRRTRCHRCCPTASRRTTGMLYLGVNADREAASDLDVPPSLLRESLDELLEAAP